MKIQKKYIINPSYDFETGPEECRETLPSLYYDHLPTREEIAEIMKKYECDYVHVGRYYKRVH